jgi:cytochrome b561
MATPNTKTFVAAGGGIAAAVASALCCAGPLVAVALGLSGSLGSGSSSEQYDLMDINGDGLPDLVAKDKELGDALNTVHKSLNFLMLGLVLAHIGGALKHHFIEHDDILARMLPFLRRKP